MKTKSQLEADNLALTKALATANIALLAIKKHVRWVGISLAGDGRDLTAREADAIRRSIDLDGMEPYGRK